MVMPYIRIEVTREGVTKEQKQQLIGGIAKLMQDILNKPPHLTHVVIAEVETDNWGVGGEQVSELRKQQLK